MKSKEVIFQRIYSVCGKKFKEAVKNGPLAGFEIDREGNQEDGSFHPVDSDQLSFELAAKLVSSLPQKQQACDPWADHEAWGLGSRRKYGTS